MLRKFTLNSRDNLRQEETEKCIIEKISMLTQSFAILARSLVIRVRWYTMRNNRPDEKRRALLFDDRRTILRLP